MSTLLLFLDGVGLGPRDPARNPFLHARLPTLHTLLGGIPTLESLALGNGRARLYPTDATLGVPGLPQSGTGQTAILTGRNAPAALGMHYGPYPNEALRTLLQESNLFQTLRTVGKRVTLANAYPPIFFERLARGKARRSAMVQAALAAGVRLRDLADLQQGEALSSLSLTNQAWRERGAPVPLLTRAGAGANLARLALAHDLTVLEYSLTDIAGHRGDHAWSIEVLEEVDELLRGVLEATDALTVVLTSDHGNIEDWAAKSHTLNPVPTIALGPGRAAFEGIRTLVDLTPALARQVASTPRVLER